MNQNKQIQTNFQKEKQKQYIQTNIHKCKTNKQIYENNNTSSSKCLQSYSMNDDNLYQNEIRQEIQKQHKQALKKLAFENFSNQTNYFEQNEKILIKMFEKNNQLHQKKQNFKQVTFNLQRNQTYFVQNFEQDYYLNQEQKSNIYLPYSKQENLSDADYSEDDEYDCIIENSKIQVTVQVNYKIKSILKQNNQSQTEQNQSTKKVILISDKENENETAKQMDITQKEVLQKKIKDHQYGVGLKFLEKLGFELGTGLGVKKQGILEPVELREQNTFEGAKIIDTTLQIKNESFLRKKRKIETIILSDEEDVSSTHQQMISFNKQQNIVVQANTS